MHGRVVGAVAVSQALMVVSQGAMPCSRAMCRVAGAAPAPCRGLVGRVATQQPHPKPPFWSQYNLCIAIQFLAIQVPVVTIQ